MSHKRTRSAGEWFELREINHLSAWHVGRILDSVSCRPLNTPRPPSSRQNQSARRRGTARHQPQGRFDTGFFQSRRGQTAQYEGLRDRAILSVGLQVGLRRAESPRLRLTTSIRTELMALRDLAANIAEHGQVIPIIEPVNDNATTRISLDRYVEVAMPFFFVCNPYHGAFANNTEQLFADITNETLMEYDNWTPALQVNVNSAPSAITPFLQRYSEWEVAVIYSGLPTNTQAVALLSSNSIAHHVFLEGHVGAAYINGIPIAQRVMVSDRFHRRVRNADYPEHEFFTDMNASAGNPQRLDFGDYSIVGDHFAETGGPAYAVTAHHIHYQGGSNPGPLEISHFISDHTETATNPSGKVIEAVHHLVEALDDLHPNNTEACDEYREMDHEQVSRGLGYLKRLAIKHHLEVMLSGGILP